MNYHQLYNEVAGWLSIQCVAITPIEINGLIPSQIMYYTNSVRILKWLPYQKQDGVKQ